MDQPNSLRERSNALKKQVRKQTIGYILAALGLVAGLAWNDAIKALIQHLFPLSQNSIAAQFIYALLITIVVIVISLYLTKLGDSDSEQPK